MLNIKGTIIKNKALIICSSLLFLIGVIAGSFMTPTLIEQNKLIEPNSLSHLFINNLLAILFIASGFFTLGIGTIVFVAINSLTIGLSIKESHYLGKSFFEIFFKIIPHGIFEVPALILSGVIGFKSIMFLIEYMGHSINFKSLLKKYIKEISTLFFIIIVLLFISALIEWYITPRIF